MSNTKIRKELHWLPIPHRIQYKLLLLTYKSLHGQGPKYLSDLLEPYTSRQASRLAKDGGALTLKVHSTKYSEYGDRAFTVTAPVYWNNLPGYIRNIQNLENFKKHLKHTCFQRPIWAQKSDI